MIKSRSVIAIPPGATIKEQLVDRGMSQKEFAARMDMSEKHISRLINGEVILTADAARRLEMVLGLPAHFWNNLESIYREDVLRAEEENNMDLDLQIADRFPYREMQKNGWVEKTNSKYEKVVALRKFFEVVKLSIVIESSPMIACRRLSITEKSDYALIAWSQKAKLEARAVKTKAINIQGLNNLLPKIREMTSMNPNDFCPELCSKLADVGIALVFLPHIGGSYLHGAAFYDKNKIVIGLTVRRKDADIFWFSLFHELSHIILGHINKLEAVTAEEESEADRLAGDILIPEDQLQRFVEDRDFSGQAVKNFASLIKVDSGIVVGRLQKEGYIPYSSLNDLKTRYELVG